MCVVPTAAPENLHLQSLTPRDLFVSWQPPPIAERNGEITHYTIGVEDEDGVDFREIETEHLSVLVEGLQPFQLYYVYVSASTVIGQGPTTGPSLIEMPEDGKESL